MALIDTLATRLSAILTGAYPVVSPYITASTFVAGEIYLPHQNPEWPGGAARAAVNRRFDLIFGALGFTPEPSPNAAQGPWTRTVPFTVRVQYEITRPTPLAPRDRALVLGALSTASKRAADDQAVLEWALVRPGALSGVTGAAGLTLRGSEIVQADDVRLVLSVRAEVLLQQSATTTPGLWT